MSKYIDADALAHKVVINGDADFINRVTKLIIDTPSIDIVHCRECKHREEYPCKVYHDDDWYCADGEREERR